VPRSCLRRAVGVVAFRERTCKRGVSPCEARGNESGTAVFLRPPRRQPRVVHLCLQRPRARGGSEKLRIGLIGCVRTRRVDRDLFERMRMRRSSRCMIFPGSRNGGRRSSPCLRSSATSVGGLQKLIEGNVDAVAIESPAYSSGTGRGGHSRRGKHVSRSHRGGRGRAVLAIVDAAKKASGSWRLLWISRRGTMSFFRGARSGCMTHDRRSGARHVFYHTGVRTACETGNEPARWRNWVFARRCRHIIVEQKSRLDVANWYLQGHR